MTDYFALFFFKKRKKRTLFAAQRASCLVFNTTLSAKAEILLVLCGVRRVCAYTRGPYVLGIRRDIQH
jgi:hypothetical protein